jgi:hypothetical protein
MSRISSCGSAMISFKSGTSGYFSWAAAAIGSLVAGVAGTSRFSAETWSRRSTPYALSASSTLA